MILQMYKNKLDVTTKNSVTITRNLGKTFSLLSYENRPRIHFKVSSVDHSVRVNKLFIFVMVMRLEICHCLTFTFGHSTTPTCVIIAPHTQHLTPTDCTMSGGALQSNQCANAGAISCNYFKTANNGRQQWWTLT